MGVWKMKSVENVECRKCGVQKMKKGLDIDNRPEKKTDRITTN